jgi:hypothetical protein
MRHLPPGQIKRPHNSEERQRALAGMANELCDLIANATPETRQRELHKAIARFSEAVPLNEKEVMQTVQRSVDEIGNFARLIHLNVGQTTFGKQMRQFSQGSGGHAAADDSGAADGVLAEEGMLETALAADDGEPIDPQAVLTAGIQDISNTLVDSFKLNDILRMILETMYRAMGFKRVLLCIRDAKAGVMQGRFGFGPDANEVARAFRFPMSFTPDIFHAATSKGVDILINDVNDPNIVQRIPEWYRKAVPAQSLVLFPLNLKGNPVALIYADRDEAGGISIPEKELALLRTLRNQAVLAIKQGS